MPTYVLYIIVCFLCPQCPFPSHGAVHGVKPRHEQPKYEERGHVQPYGLIRTPNAPKNCEQKTVTSKRPTVQGNEESDTYKSFPSFTERALVPSGWICFLRRVALAHSFACSSTPIQYSCIWFFFLLTISHSTLPALSSCTANSETRYGTLYRRTDVYWAET